MSRLSNLKKVQPKLDHFCYGRGKLLLSGEYFVLDGARALALPVSVGQSLSVRYVPSFNPVLYWKSFDSDDNLWFQTSFEFWHFDCLEENPDKEVLFLQKILRQARKQNSHFLRDEVDVFVETRLEFPLDWGLGSSSTLIHNVANWAYISPFELLFNVYGGSGYDVAVAQSECPIVYEKDGSVPKWSLGSFDPPFRNNLYFVHLDRKQNSMDAIEHYNCKKPHDKKIIEALSGITEKMEKANTLFEFECMMKEHEEIISKTLELQRARDKFFSDYWGEIKSLGAWGGDFVLASSDRNFEETRKYFAGKGFNVVIPYEQLVLNNNEDDFVNQGPIERFKYLH
ncbi:MAG: hypothetical protein KAQ98_04400 [Bacteriovoracaceae bacterium]|nr:hypothetical protein [Bacteriovoracaceae bacterium]